RRACRMGFGVGFRAGFAVGCPVCTRSALLALGCSGAIRWFAPLQPVLAIGALILPGLALLWRLPAQISCPPPSAAPTPQEKAETAPSRAALLAARTTTPRAKLSAWATSRH